MKRGWLLTVGFGILWAISNSEGHSLNLEAHETGTADGTYTKWYSDSGSYDRDFRRTKQILITVRDLSRKVAAVTVHVYFIAHPQGRTGPLFVYGHATVPVELHGNIEVIGEVEAPVIDANVQYYAGLGVTHMSGADIDGWIVVGEVGDQVFQVRASRQALLDLAQKQPQKLREMVEEYEKRKPRR